MQLSGLIAGWKTFFAILTLPAIKIVAGKGESLLVWPFSNTAGELFIAVAIAHAFASLFGILATRFEATPLPRVMTYVIAILAAN